MLTQQITVLTQVSNLFRGGLVPYCGKGRIGSAYRASDNRNSRQLSFRQTGFSETGLPGLIILGTWASGKRGSRKPTDLRLINHQTRGQTAEIAVSTANPPWGARGRTVYESHQLRWFVRFNYGLQGFDIC